MMEFEELNRLALEIVYKLRVGEVAYAFSLYPGLISGLLAILDVNDREAFGPLFAEMLKAQEHSNVVWLADLIEYVLLDSLNAVKHR